MAIYAIGDLQGCLTPLQKLLDKIRFDPAHDRLWFTGDLVNRGSHSLETLRFVTRLGSRAISVLGNHDLNLLAVSEGRRKTKSRDTLQEILDAPDSAELLQWLRHLPLLHHDAALGYTLIHAGLPPQWDLETAQALAKKTEMLLRASRYHEMLNIMYGDYPDIWSETFTEHEQFRFVTNCFTRLRFCDIHGKLAITQKGAPGTQTKGLMPWFEHPNRKSAHLKIIFGHWSALGIHITKNIFALDSGCVWGGKLTALRIDTPEPSLVSVDCT